MKKLAIGLFTLASLSSFARVFGTPDEDPVVANLRSRFETGKEPKAEYLLQNTFKCKEITAKRGDFKQEDYYAELRFEKFDGFLTSVNPSTTMDKVLYSFNGNELIGLNEGIGTLYEAYRVDSKGYLISEYSSTRGGPSAELSPISFSKGNVISYTLCISK